MNEDKIKAFLAVTSGYGSGSGYGLSLIHI